MTSLQFMLVWVPLPVWNTTSGKCSSNFPWITCSLGNKKSVRISVQNSYAKVAKNKTKILCGFPHVRHRPTYSERGKLTPRAPHTLTHTRWLHVIECRIRSSVSCGGQASIWFGPWSTTGRASVLTNSPSLTAIWRRHLFRLKDKRGVENDTNRERT